MYRKDVPIHTPCGADFSKMTRVDARARLCEDCQEIVHDLTGRSDAEIRELLSGGPACVRYVYDATGKILNHVPAGATVVPVFGLMKKLKDSRWAAAAALATTAVAFEACGGNDGFRKSRVYDEQALAEQQIADRDPAIAADANAPGVDDAAQPIEPTGAGALQQDAVDAGPAATGAETHDIRTIADAGPSPR